jgi:hypothetical protein
MIWDDLDGLQIVQEQHESLYDTTVVLLPPTGWRSKPCAERSSITQRHNELLESQYFIRAPRDS